MMVTGARPGGRYGEIPDISGRSSAGRQRGKRYRDPSNPTLPNKRAVTDALKRTFAQAAMTIFPGPSWPRRP
jgi:hypothetical protein